MKKLRIIYSVILILLICGRIFLYNNNLNNVYKVAEDTRKFSISGRVCTQVNETAKTHTAYLKVLEINPKINIDKISLIIPKSSDLDIQYGDRLEFIAKLTIPEDELNDGGFSYRDYLKSKNVSLVANLADKSNKNTKVYNKGCDSGIFVKTQKTIHKLQNACINHLETYFKGDNLGLIKAVITGDRDSISGEMKQVYIRSGTYHIVAISGLHASVLICFVAFPLLLLNITNGKRKRARSIIALLTAVFLLAFTGYGISVYKVLFMSLVVLIAILGRRKYNPVHSLFYALIGILIFMPYKTYDAGLWLSISSTYGIIIQDRVSGYINKKFPRLLKSKVSYAFLPGVLSCITSMPATVYYFSRISYLAPLSNIFVVPLASILVVCCAVFSVLGFLPHNILKILALIPNIFATLINKITKLISAIPFSSVYVSYLLFFAICISLLVPITVYILYKTGRKRLCLVLSTITAILSLSVFLISASTDKMFVNVLNTENGLATIITLKDGPSNKYYMFDCGSENDINMAENTIIPYMSSKGITSIDTLFISYTGKNCVNGAYNLIKNNMVKNVVLYDIKTYNIKEADTVRRTLIHNAGLKGINICYVKDGDILKDKDFEVEIMNNCENSIFKADNASCVYKVNYKNTSLVLSGWAGLSELNGLSKDRKLSADLAVITKTKYYKALTNFIDSVNPTYIALSQGKGVDKKLRGYFNENKITLNQTIYDKTITYESDGNIIRLKKLKNTE